MNDIQTKYPLVSIISINFNNLEVTAEMLQSLRQISYPNIEIIIVDNASEKERVDLLKERFPEIILIKSPENTGFAGGNNLGIVKSKGKYILLLNNDTVVDPLDGTKEFISHNGEFTVNIALIKNQRPIMGIVFCPPLKTIYFASQHLEGSFKAVLGDDPLANVPELITNASRLPLLQSSGCLTIVASRSHLNDETVDFISKLKNNDEEVNLLTKGSSLKFCLVAEGAADIYPRFAPTCEWDTAAAQAIVELAGGNVFISNTNEPLVYNKPHLLNPFFIVRRK
jgi:3'(2'),5'-bisphosphate nucleotidase